MKISNVFAKQKIASSTLFIVPAYAWI